MCVFYVQAAEQPLAEEDQVRATLHRAPPCGAVLPQGESVCYSSENCLSNVVLFTLVLVLCAPPIIIYSMGAWYQYVPSSVLYVCTCFACELLVYHKTMKLSLFLLK